MASDTDFNDDDFTRVDVEFFRRGDELEHAPELDLELFEDLDDPAPSRSANRWLHLRGRLARVLRAPSHLSRRGRRTVYVGAGLLALCSIALAVPNDDQHLATSVARSAPPARTPPRILSEDLRAAQTESKEPARTPPRILSEDLRAAQTESKEPARTLPRILSEDLRAAQTESKEPARTPPRILSEDLRAAQTESKGQRHFDRGLQAWKRGDLASARRSFSAAARAGHAPGYRGLGEVHRKQGKHADAIRAFRTYLRVAPNGNDAAKVRRTLAALERG